MVVMSFSLRVNFTDEVVTMALFGFKIQMRECLPGSIVTVARPSDSFRT